MRTWAKAALGVLVVLWLGGCSGIPVNTDYDPAFQMPANPTYGWMAKPHHEQNALIDNDLLARRVHRAVDEQLAAAGVRPVAAGQEPNLLVTYHVGREDKMDIDTTDGFYGYYGYYPCWACWGPPAGRDIWVNYYTQDTLVIDIIDAKTRHLVWRGVADRRLPSFKTPQERDTYIQETVQAIFKHFPPGRNPG